ncbi:LacI family DNA-binding transcriptional regulator [Falsibacillus albus]|uniref:LacI family DNA-binding transcriptional regulator n=1 Tax=Falsibacillus albus TaxID=2478915 RepID=A0A3L7K546_9BACI|nr:LacI family DNA-binding transcriptional regulator [Falsibacillus albus]RLQ97399.1 LacI family DNA-binding transcriptional regulator [Falsibacillus albus]
MGNIREIAKEAGVSVTTASRVLNHHPYVSVEKRQAVWAAVERLNYTKNVNAVHLSNGKTNSVGVVLPFLNLPYYGEWLHGIAEEALKYGTSLQVFQTNYQKSIEIEALQKLKSRQVDGLIIASRANEWDIISSFEEEGHIIICERIDDPQVSTVYIDHYDVFKKGIRMLKDHGYDSIGVCIHRRFGTNSQERIKAYFTECEMLQVKGREEWIFTDCYTMKDGKEIFHKWQQLQERPSALIVTSDQVAAGIVSEARLKGIEVPGDLAILSSDNHPIAEIINLTSIDIPVRKLGKRSFELFIENTKGNTIIHEELDALIVKRGTV